MIDFSGVNFISRSCADEYLKQKKSTYKKITEINKNINIERMFKIVSTVTTYHRIQKSDTIVVI